LGEEAPACRIEQLVDFNARSRFLHALQGSEYQWRVALGGIGAGGTFGLSIQSLMHVRIALHFRV
jgi:hypothetical protein